MELQGTSPESKQVFLPGCVRCGLEICSMQNHEEVLRICEKRKLILFVPQ